MKLDTGGTRAVNSEAMATVHPKTLCDREAPTGKHLLLCQPRRSAGTICAINVQQIQQHPQVQSSNLIWVPNLSNCHQQFCLVGFCPVCQTVPCAVHLKYFICLTITEFEGKMCVKIVCVWEVGGGGGWRGQGGGEEGAQEFGKRTGWKREHVSLPSATLLTVPLC